MIAAQSQGSYFSKTWSFYSSSIICRTQLFVVYLNKHFYLLLIITARKFSCLGIWLAVSWFLRYFIAQTWLINHFYVRYDCPHLTYQLVYMIQDTNISYDPFLEIFRGTYYKTCLLLNNWWKANNRPRISSMLKNCCRKKEKLYHLFLQTKTQ